MAPFWLKTNEDDTVTAYERASNHKDMPPEALPLMRRALADPPGLDRAERLCRELAQVGRVTPCPEWNLNWLARFLKTASLSGIFNENAGLPAGRTV